MRKNLPIAELKTKAVFRYRVGFIRNGVRHLSKKWVNNLILDTGLDKVATMSWANCFKFCLFGDQVSPTPIQRDSGGISFAQVGTAITASGGFFEAGDTGRLLKYDSGEEVYLTFIDSTHATASLSFAIVAQPGTVWYVNQTQLESLFDSTNTYGFTGGDNGSTFSVDTLTLKRTFLGTAVAAPVTLTEIGWSNSASNSNIFDRDIISGGVALIIGDIPFANCELLLTFVQTSPGAVGNVATGYDSSGTSQVVCISFTGGFPNVDLVLSNGNTDAGNASLEPYFIQNIQVLTATFSIPSFTSGHVNDLSPAAAATTDTLQSYSAGNFYRESVAFFSIAAGNGTIYGIQSTSGNCAWAQLFTTPFTKAGTQTLTFTTRKAWQRVLQN